MGPPGLTLGYLDGIWRYLLPPSPTPARLTGGTTCCYLPPPGPAGHIPTTTACRTLPCHSRTWGVLHHIYAASCDTLPPAPACTLPACYCLPPLTLHCHCLPGDYYLGLLSTISLGPPGQVLLHHLRRLPLLPVLLPPGRRTATLLPHHTAMTLPATLPATSHYTHPAYTSCLWKTLLTTFCHLFPAHYQSLLRYHLTGSTSCPTSWDLYTPPA